MANPKWEDPRITSARAILDDYSVARIDYTNRRDVLYALGRMESAVRMLLDFADEHIDLTPGR